MTKPSSEILQALRLRIAELCGISFAGILGFQGYGYLPNGDAANVPDYCEDLNAIHEAEKLLEPAFKLSVYSNRLNKIVADCFYEGDIGLSGESIAFAEAWQRAVALDRCLSKEPIL